MSNLSNVTYTANGSTTIFTLPFTYIEVADITVTVDGVTKAITTDYTFNVSSNGTASLSVNSTNRQHISYHGKLVPIEEKES